MNDKRLLTKEVKAMSHSDVSRRNPHSHLGGWVIESAEGLHWYGSATPLPRAIGEVALTDILDEQFLQPQALETKE